MRKKLLQLFDRKAKLKKRKNDIFLGLLFLSWLTFFCSSFLVGKYDWLKKNHIDWLGSFLAGFYLSTWLINGLKLQKLLSKITQIDKEIAEELSKL